jgi:hypothetical protein
MPSTSCALSPVSSRCFSVPMMGRPAPTVPCRYEATAKQYSFQGGRDAEAVLASLCKGNNNNCVL